MKARATGLSAATTALLLMLVIACEGPAGPQGPQGPEGPQGPMGNANVQSDSTTLSDSDWETGRIYFQTSPNSSISRAALVATLDVPAITEEIKSSGMVKVYFKTIDGFGADPTIWTALPYSIMAFGGDYTYNITYTYDTGTITLYYYYEPNSSDATTPNLADATLPDYKFKWVVASADAAASMASAGINVEDHDAVAQFLDRRFDAGIQP